MLLSSKQRLSQRMSEPLDTDDTESARVWLDARQAHSAWLLFEGGALLMFGLLAAALPWIMRSRWTDVMGLLLLSAGVVELISCLGMRRAPGLRWSLLSSLLAPLAGALLLLRPGHGINPLALASCFVLVFLLLDGALSMGCALSHRGAGSPGWGWMLVGGLAQIALGALMIKTLIDMDRPGLMLTLPGMALMGHGLMLVLMGRAARREPAGQELASRT
jgi:uncharacterized membrane protein HdeD (DUF308 family)